MSPEIKGCQQLRAEVIDRDLCSLRGAAFGAPYAAGPIGTVKDVLTARAAGDGVRSRGQYGGAVSALASFAIEHGLIDSMVLTSSGRDILPEGTLARDAARVLDCARSNYVAAPTLAAFNQRAGGADVRRAGVAATPCQALALAKMRASPLENRNSIDKLGLVIGLFCTGALRYRESARFLGQRARR